MTNYFAYYISDINTINNTYKSTSIISFSPDNILISGATDNPISTCYYLDSSNVWCLAKKQYSGNTLWIYHYINALSLVQCSRLTLDEMYTSGYIGWQQFNRSTTVVNNIPEDANQLIFLSTAFLERSHTDYVKKIYYFNIQMWIFPQTDITYYFSKYDNSTNIFICNYTDISQYSKQCSLITDADFGCTFTISNNNNYKYYFQFSRIYNGVADTTTVINPYIFSSDDLWLRSAIDADLKTGVNVLTLKEFTPLVKVKENKNAKVTLVVNNVEYTAFYKSPDTTFSIKVSNISTGYHVSSYKLYCKASKRTIVIPNTNTSLVNNNVLESDYIAYLKADSDDQMFQIYVETEYASGCDATCNMECGTVCNSTCASTCSNGCAHTCGTNCDKGCYTVCTATCKTECKDGCTFRCTNGCASDCEAKCGACHSSCTLTCKSSCDSSCGNGCNNGCSTECTTDCTKDCYQTCQTKCTGACQSCSNACESNCNSTCKEECTYACTTGCKITCEGTCGKSNCTTNCSGSCEGDCTGGCNSKCSNTCSKGCFGSCKYGCFGCQSLCYKSNLASSNRVYINKVHK